MNNDLFVNNGVQIFHAQEIAPGGNNDIVNNGMYKNYGEISVDFFEDNQITFENADTLINYGILEGRDTIAPCDACSCFCLTMHLYLMKLILLTPVHLLIMKILR